MKMAWEKLSKLGYKTGGLVLAEHSVDHNYAEWEAAHNHFQRQFTGETQYIFLEQSGQQKLRQAALRAGFPHDKLNAWIQYHPEGRRKNAIVRHAKGHVGHIHVRFQCAQSERRCEA